jgi:O-antigen ligase
VIGRFLTHSHNFFLQIWGDNGIIAATFTLFCLALIVRRLLRNTTPGFCLDPDAHYSWEIAFGSTALFAYLFLFNMVELGMLKVPILTALFGHFLASVFYLGGPGQELAREPQEAQITSSQPFS